MKHTPPPRRVRGFTLVELMVGVTIGLLCTMLVASVLGVSEGQRRGSTAGSDAQVSGALALYAVQRDVAMAGYGFGSEPSAVGCALQSSFNGAAVPQMPTQLAPVLITQAATPQGSDELRILASSKLIDASGTSDQVGYSIPTRIMPPLYDPNAAVPARRNTFTVLSTQGLRARDLLVAVVNADEPCSLFEAVQAPISPTELVLVAEPSRWNPAQHPATAMQDRCAATQPCMPKNASGSLLINLGRLLDLSYRVDAQDRLVVRRFDTDTRRAEDNIVQSHIVMLKALYGRDTDDDGAVDTYDYATPATAAGWARVLAVRLALVSRSTQREREAITPAAPEWRVGTSAAVAGSGACRSGTGHCVPLALEARADWQHYRYKVFDLVVPLRNQRWRS